MCAPQYTINLPPALLSARRCLFRISRVGEKVSRCWLWLLESSFACLASWIKNPVACKCEATLEDSKFLCMEPFHLEFLQTRESWLASHRGGFGRSNIQALKTLHVIIPVYLLCLILNWTEDAFIWDEDGCSGSRCFGEMPKAKKRKQSKVGSSE